MVLLHNVVEILDLADPDRGAVLLIIALDGGFIRRTPIDRDLLRYAMVADRLLQKPEGGLLIALLGQEKVNGVALLIHGTIEVAPRAFALDGGLVHPPTDPHGTLAAVKRFFQLGAVFHDPALDGRVVDRYPPLLQEFFDMPIAQGIRHIPAHPQENDILREMGPLEAHRHRLSPSLLSP